MLIPSLLVKQLQVMLVENPAVGCHWFLPGKWLPSELQRIAALGWYQFTLAGEERHMCVNDLPKVEETQTSDL